MRIVLMDANHVEAVARLEEVCFSDPWSVNAISSEVKNPLSLWFVAMEEDEVIGYIGSQSVIDQADIMNVAVAPAYRRRGVAVLLVNRLQAELAPKGVKYLFLEVRVTNDPAKSLYEKLGFEVVGRRPGYYTKPKEDALIMRKELGL